MCNFFKVSKEVVAVNGVHAHFPQNDRPMKISETVNEIFRDICDSLPSIRCIGLVFASSIVCNLYVSYWHDCLMEDATRSMAISNAPNIMAPNVAYKPYEYPRYLLSTHAQVEEYPLFRFN